MHFTFVFFHIRLLDRMTERICTNTRKNTNKSKYVKTGLITVLNNSYPKIGCTCGCPICLF